MGCLCHSPSRDNKVGNPAIKPSKPSKQARQAQQTSPAFSKVGLGVADGWAAGQHLHLLQSVTYGVGYTLLQFDAVCCSILLVIACDFQ